MRKMVIRAATRREMVMRTTAMGKMVMRTAMRTRMDWAEVMTMRRATMMMIMAVVESSLFLSLFLSLAEVAVKRMISQTIPKMINLRMNKQR